ncbi:hypothetical protein [Streptomyces sp. KR80]|uniref:hypothetical protein n=1 Tax=Streptomyces sp. KR80 TaxID=3457426 RepID=UPI003FD46D83
MALARHADINRFWFGRTVSNFGDKISLLALPTLAVVVLDGCAFEVGVLGALRFLPFLLFAPLAGLVADRVSRRMVMIVADLGRFATLATGLASGQHIDSTAPRCCPSCRAAATLQDACTGMEGLCRTCYRLGETRS